VDIGSYSNAREEGIGDWKDGISEESKTQNGIVEYHCNHCIILLFSVYRFFSGMPTFSAKRTSSARDCTFIF
jgi:hypothetical protein